MSGMPQAGGIQRAAIYLRSSFWFVPACLMVAAIALALGLVEIDQRVDPQLRERWPRMFAGEAEGSRAMLSAIATSMITVAGVVFSITIVALAQAATQYTSRVLRNFMRDRINQVVLGVFVGVFTYGLIVLRTINGAGDRAFVPSLAVFAGLLLAIIAIGFLIVFIHHISTTIQAGEIAHRVMVDTRHAIDRLFPDEVGQAAELVPPEAVDPGQAWQPVASIRTGYVQGVMPDALLAFAVRHDTVVRMEAGVGEFVTEGRPIAWLALERPVDHDTAHAFNRLYAVDTYRTTDQDPAFGFRQLVDIALKALSPGINDTTTAITCIDYLSMLLGRLARRRMESPWRSEGRRLRVIARGPSFAELAGLAFGQILENAEGNSVVLERLLRMAGEVATQTAEPDRRRVLREWVGVIEEVALRGARSTHARNTLAAHVARARGACA